MHSLNDFRECTMICCNLSLIIQLFVDYYAADIGT